MKVNCAALPTLDCSKANCSVTSGGFHRRWVRRRAAFILPIGLLFLDEIGDLPLELQPEAVYGSFRNRSLRGSAVAHDTRRCSRGGGDEPGSGPMVQGSPVPSRLVLSAQCFPDRASSARERSKTFPFLSRHFVGKFARRRTRKSSHIPERGDGGVHRNCTTGRERRELQNFLERALIMCCAAFSSASGELGTDGRNPDTPSTAVLVRGRR